MTYFHNPFTLLASMSQAPVGSNVVVVSDAMYKEYKQKQAKQEIEILEARAKSYRTTADLIEQEIVTIKTDAGLLPAAESDVSD